MVIGCSKCLGPLGVKWGYHKQPLIIALDAREKQKQKALVKNFSSSASYTKKTEYIEPPGTDTYAEHNQRELINEI